MKAELDRLVSMIVKEADPLRIFLFGSAARGELHPESDLDLLVVMPDGTHRRRTAQNLYRRLSGIGASFDLVVTTPSDLKKHANNPGLIYRNILPEARELYAA